MESRSLNISFSIPSVSVVSLWRSHTLSMRSVSAVSLWLNPKTDQFRSQ
jgi:hypothetical protein